MTTTDPGEAFTKELVMEQTDRVILLADSSKMGKVSFVTVGSLSRIKVLITDLGLDRRLELGLRKRGIEVEKV
jgi:DeoR/GlpR family transcriptional regulator of sugar metabolism